MAALEALGIAGFRSYSPEFLQKIEFETPLTLIWGKNGSGKTTIIEVLKYITTGALPPCCDKGKNFIMDPQLLGQSELVGDARLKFATFNGRPVLAKRRTMLSITSRGPKIQAIQQTLKTKDEQGEMFEINHHCAEIEKQIPQLLGISKAVLENIVFCHQDESLWPFSDNTNLKTIFDEMFETHRTTRMLEAYWDKHKQYVKEIKEAKKSQEYLARLYHDDNRKKRHALTQLQNAAHDAGRVGEAKRQLAALIVSNEAADRKYALMQRKGVLEEKLNTATRIAKDQQLRLQLLAKDYEAAAGRPISSRTQPVNQEVLKAMQDRAQELQKQRIDLQQRLDESRNTNLFNQKQMELLSEVRRAKQCFPQLKSQTNEEEVQRFLIQHIKQMGEIKAQLNQLRAEASRIVLPSLLDLPLSESAYYSMKKQAETYAKRLNECKADLLLLFNHLHRPVSPVRPAGLNQNAENDLRQLHMRLRLKRQELAEYQGRPPQQNLILQKMKLQYSGIDFQQAALDYCTERMRCLICSKPLLQKDLQTIKQRAERSAIKTKDKIEALEANAGGQPIGIDPQQIIPLLKHEIAELQGAEGQLIEQYQEYTHYKSQVDQLKLNDTLLRHMKRLGLDKEPVKSAFLPPEPTIQCFSERVSTYENLRFKLEPMERALLAYQDRSSRNRQIEEQRRQAEAHATSLRKRIAVCQHESQNYDMACNIQQNLATLLKNRPRQSASKLKGDPQSPSFEQLQQQMTLIVGEAKAVNIEKEYCGTATEAANAEQNRKSVAEQLKAVEKQLKQVDEALVIERQHAQEKKMLQMQYAARKREVELRGKIAFQEHNRPPEQEYLIRSLELAVREEMNRELQQYCKALEGSISTYHRQKMDQVNKYISEIWRQVYHGDDIELIEVQASFNEDSKRHKSYSYSIMMKKGGRKMEMKGRCSMGQKVLASIIIRLGLAQVFSSSARILALDQPTTNLDREHITNLAHQLGRLIELNEGRHLQMIIISHDMQLVRMMEKYTSSYYEVSRDHHLHSVITRRDIKDIYNVQK